MPRTSPYRIVLSSEEHLSWRPGLGNIRCRIVTWSEPGSSCWQPRDSRNDEIARRLDTRREVVSLWRKRFFEQRLAGLEELPRHGRPAIFFPQVAIEVKAIACELPSRLDLPLSRLFVPDIKAEVIRRGIVASISGSTIWRWLDNDAIRPWTFRSWIFPRDPAFEAKAGRVLDLYGRRFEGKALGSNDCVVSADYAE